MPSSILIPLQVFGIGIVISYGIALLIQVLLVAIKFFTKNPSKSQFEE
jgi:hypothetical protein